MEEKSCLELLRSWQVPDEVIKNFVDNGITNEYFSKLTEDHLKELCPHMGIRILLKEKITELINANAVTESISGSTSYTNKEIEVGQNEKVDNNLSILTLDEISFSELIPKETITRTFPEFDLATLLQTTPGGASILNFYRSFGYLNNTKRNQLTDIIVKHIYTHIVNSKITYEEYNILAAKIITLFPTESIGTYYTKPIKKNQSINNRSTIAKGKLVDKVRNLIYKYGDNKRKSTTDSENQPAQRKSKLNLQETHQSALLWLQNYRNPWEEVEKKWKDTFVLRRETEYQKLHDFLKTWNILEDKRSDTLINIDFELLYPDKALNFFLKWDDFFKRLITLRPTQDEAILNVINSIENLEDDLKIPSQIYVLGHLVPPKGRLTKKVKFSTQEALDNIFFCAKTAGDVDNIITSQKEKASLRKISVQPYIILQGAMNQCSSPLLIIDNVKYSFNSIRKAFNTLFKVYHVFHANYPKSSDHLYLIIQRCVYDIETKYDNVVPYIVDILKLR